MSQKSVKDIDPKVLMSLARKLQQQEVDETSASDSENGTVKSANKKHQNYTRRKNQSSSEEDDETTAAEEEEKVKPKKKMIVRKRIITKAEVQDQATDAEGPSEQKKEKGSKKEPKEAKEEKKKGVPRPINMGQYSSGNPRSMSMKRVDPSKNPSGAVLSKSGKRTLSEYQIFMGQQCKAAAAKWREEHPNAGGPRSDAQRKEPNSMKGKFFAEHKNDPRFLACKTGIERRQWMSEEYSKSKIV